MWLCDSTSDCRSRGPGFDATCCFETWAISFTPRMFLLDETLKAVGPFYLVFMSREVKDQTQRNFKKPVVDSLTLEKEHSDENKPHMC